jgi:hypothetical protein
MKKGFVHIKEYDLTKRILDRLDVDIEEGYQLVHEIESLQYKDKPLILPDYKEFMNYAHTGTVIRPFINQAHGQYLINMFSDVESCTAIFEYSVNDSGGYDGKLDIKDDKTGFKKTIAFKGIKNIPVLMSTLILKALLPHDDFRDIIRDILKLDKKIEAR